MDGKRIVFWLDAETLKDVDRIKQVTFFDRSYAVLYRYLIKLGLERAKERV